MPPWSNRDLLKSRTLPDFALAIRTIGEATPTVLLIAISPALPRTCTPLRTGPSTFAPTRLTSSVERTAAAPIDLPWFVSATVVYPRLEACTTELSDTDSPNPLRPVITLLSGRKMYSGLRGFITLFGFRAATKAPIPPPRPAVKTVAMADSSMVCRSFRTCRPVS